MKVQIHRASDGKDFDTKEACADHDHDLMIVELCNLDAPSIVRALSGDSPKLAAAIEFIGSALAKNRRAAGDLKRKAKVPTK